MMDSHGISVEEAVPLALRNVIGAYAIVIINKNEPDRMIAARKGSPLVIGVGEDEYFVGSDASPIIEFTNKVVYLDEGQIAYIQRGKDLRVTDLKSVEQTPVVRELEMSLSEIEKGGYPHFMLKEIFEQPRTLRASMQGRLHPELGTVKLSGIIDNRERILGAKRFVICACGTSWHAGLIGKYIIEELTRIPVDVEYASEFRYRKPVIFPTDVVIAISQSGETADTLAAIKQAKEAGAFLFGICNVVGSSIARETDTGCYTHIGPEIGVASTKAFTAQVTTLFLIALSIAEQLGTVSDERRAQLVNELQTIPDKIAKILEHDGEIAELAKVFTYVRNFLYLGRGYNYPVALEGALKLKEISYIHSEAYAAGELKHGTISLIEDGTLVTAVVTQEELYKKTISNIVEVKTRGAYVLAVTNEDNLDIEKTADSVIYIPKTNSYFTNSLAIIPLQLFGYYVSVGKGLDVDKPRNLAKSVTVE